MSEPFEAIGFRVTDEASYQALAEEAYHRGKQTRLSRTQGILHGCCWSLGAGLEVWTMLYECTEGMFYADCRPGFRARQVYQFYPWEIIEYEQEGEALLSGTIKNSRRHLVFALQNLTEINLKQLPRWHVTAAVSGLAYRARVLASSGKGPSLESGGSRQPVAENVYRLRGRINSWREIRNQHTTSDLYWIQVDLGTLAMEVLVNRGDLKGEPRTGHWLSAEIWLQGYVLNDQQLQARFEGVDPRIPRQHHWRHLHRGNRSGTGS